MGVRSLVRPSGMETSGSAAVQRIVETGLGNKGSPEITDSLGIWLPIIEHFLEGQSSQSSLFSKVTWCFQSCLLLKVDLVCNFPTLVRWLLWGLFVCLLLSIKMAKLVRLYCRFFMKLQHFLLYFTLPFPFGFSVLAWLLQCGTEAPVLSLISGRNPQTFHCWLCVYHIQP